MSDVQLDSALFFKRAERIFQAWENPSGDTAELEGLTALQVVLGEPNDDTPAYNKTMSLQLYLLGFEFPSTLMLFTKSPRKVTFVCSSSKAKLLKQLQSSNGIEVDIQVRSKDEGAAKQVVKDLVLSLGDGKVGSLPKDKPAGKLVDDWNAAVATSKGGLEVVDISISVSAILNEKDGEELKNLITGSKMTATTMQHYFKSKMESIIDRGTKVPHEVFAGLVEEKIGNDEKGPDMKLWNKNSSLGDVDFSSTEWVYSPIIQSGGKYDLRVTAMSDNSPLKPGVILASLGIRYKSYCTSMSRTFFISPNKKQESYYSALLEARSEALKKLKAGAVVQDVYNEVQQFVESKSPTLGQNLSKSIGFATGIEYRDSSFVLNAKNSRTLKENMVLILSLGVQELPDPKKPGKTYSLLLADTVKVGQSGAVVLTEGVTKLNDVVMDLEDEEEEESEPEVKAKPSRKTNGDAKPKSPVKTRTGAGGARAAPAKTRGANRDNFEQTTSEKIKANQARLHAQRNADGVKKWEKGGKGKDGSQDKVVKRYESYRREEQLPRAVEDRRVYVDEQRQSVVLPINGFAVPFHISTIKNVTKNEEAEHIVLRINFQSPGQIAGKKEDMPFEDPDANFIRSVSFRSQDRRHMLKVFDTITALKKTATKREAERKELADVIEQEKLVEVKGRHPYVLKNVFPRPAPEGKKTDGNVEIHQNGIRFRPDGPASKIDLLFSNIKHLFFQPSEKELIVIIHVHLKAPIMLGKKKTYDVQFYREVTDMSFDETGGKKRRARYGDEDEIEQEQEDRKRRAELDKQFHDFARRIESAAQAQQYELEVDVPFRELGFSGVPYRSNVLLLPTTNCLIHISEFPFTVITLSDVEIVHLERVQFGLKNFDMVFVLNDLKKAPIHINSIPVVHLDNVKEWLDSCDVPISEGPVNLSWPAIMKTVNDDPLAFYNEGGWEFLTGGGSDAESSESEEGSEFEEDSDAFDDESSSDDESGSDFGDDSDDSGSDEDLSDEGEDWDELERKAERADKKHREKGGDESDDDRGKKKKGGRR
ncbi:FACT complex subunit SPT16 [Kwoniella mangroviensis CBS 8507]|uniref:FACT complex subunit SPT16 n=1 Tax=Kwoniella mangroviensis CBS 8507 TaxID=1296122 RepID=UPI00080D0060|nr:FACT complex subunit SPT16 [Kwoniella mangroviensis CBS 8507]OCF63989.1 FACT complex subunit SPT16 [Kwoniella mangroviensis CBS 8507]